MGPMGVAVLLTAGTLVLLVMVTATVAYVRRRSYWLDRDEPRYVVFLRKARLLGTLPSEHDLQRHSIELSMVQQPEHLEVDGLHHQPLYSSDDLIVDIDAVTLEEDESQTIEQRIAHQIVEDHRDERAFAPVTDLVEVDRLVAEARDLMVDLNQEFGWTPGEPHIADRLFNTDVRAVIAQAKASGRIDFRTRRIIGIMRSYARAANGGRSELSKVMAMRTLIGTGRMTEEELGKLDLSRRLFGDEFAEAAGYVDKLDRVQELVASKRLGINAFAPTRQDGAAPAEHPVRQSRPKAAPKKNSGRVLDVPDITGTRRTLR